MVGVLVSFREEMYFGITSLKSKTKNQNQNNKKECESRQKKMQHSERTEVSDLHEHNGSWGMTSTTQQLGPSSAIVFHSNRISQPLTNEGAFVGT